MRSQSFEIEVLQRVANRALGPGRRLLDVTRLRGGTKKGVYRLSFDRGASVVLYVWNPDEDFWPTTQRAPLDPFSHASGLNLFEASNRLLTKIGVRTPNLMFLDRSATEVPGDIALVEDVGGQSLADLLANDASAVERPMVELRSALDAMRRSHSQHVGKIAVVGEPEAETSEPSRACETIVLERALKDLDHAASQLQTLADRQDAISSALTDAALQVRPRQNYSVVHGELGPDHVLVDGEGRASIIDIEGLMYFDVEWEHAFLRIRFPNHYNQLSWHGLDEDRMALYQLAYHLSLVAGPLQLLSGDFPERATMTRIMEWNLQQVLTIIS